MVRECKRQLTGTSSKQSSWLFPSHICCPHSLLHFGPWHFHSSCCLADIPESLIPCTHQQTCHFPFKLDLESDFSAPFLWPPSRPPTCLQFSTLVPSSLFLLHSLRALLKHTSDHSLLCTPSNTTHLTQSKDPHPHHVLQASVTGSLFPF